ncbi:SusC/RagA family TonB-linked outer membrane protein [Elizabethkingia occulta]|nr:SusC/RagA family TonB-linked outer membrane protein [Elizabethkingia occulta]
MKKRSIMMVLLASSIGLYAQEGKAKDSTKTANIQEVVITSLGIKRQARSLTYSSQQIGGDDLTEVKTPNLLNSINGKVSNVQINRASGGAGGSVRVIMRGDKSTRNSSPLLVIDGIPVTNSIGGGPGAPTADAYNGGTDSGDIFSTINPEDIQSINFLKGASAAALYGSQGSNGAILVTTKKGVAGRSNISFSSSLTFDKAYSLPKLQHNYLQTTPYDPSTGSAGSTGSWGQEGSSKDYVKDFLRTGTTWTNSITFSAGTQKSTNFFSLANTTNKGIVPNSKFDQYNINFRNSSKFFDDKLTLDANLMGSIQKVENRIAPGLYFNPLFQLYTLPRGVDFDQYKDYEYLDRTRYIQDQNWFDKTGSTRQYSQNPYWILNRNKVTSNNKNLYTSVALSYAINDWLTAKLRGNYTYFNSETSRNLYANTAKLLANPNGKLYYDQLETTALYGDFLLIGSPHISDNISFDFTVGTSVNDKKDKITAIQNNNLKNANYFELNNLNWTPTDTYKIYYPHGKTTSVFASTTFGYKKLAYIDLTFRNDWSSTLFGSSQNAFDYESIGGNLIMSDILQMPKAITFWKLRASYATVGNALEPTFANPQPTFNNGVFGNSANLPDLQRYPELTPKPELNRTFEVGTEFRMFNNRLNFDFTYYNSNVSNQYLTKVEAAPGLSKQSGTLIDMNAGKIQNTGFESSLSYDIFKTSSFNWTATLNASANKNKIKELLPANFYDASKSLFTLAGGNYNKLKVGGSFGDLYGKGFMRNADGKIVVDKDGAPLTNTDNNIYLGNPNPKFIIGLNNSFNYKNINLSFLIDGKFGGHVLSLAEAAYDYAGVSQRSADARKNGGVSIPNAVYEDGTAYTGKTDAKKYYERIGGQDAPNIDEAYIYKATAIRLRQVSLSYTFKMNSKYMQDATVSFIGSNLFFFYKKAPFDPEQVSGVNPGGVGVDVYGMPITRSLGLSVKLNF